MLVLIDLPSATAVSEQPAPRWHTTRRGGARPSSSRARLTLYSTLSP